MLNTKYEYRCDVKDNEKLRASFNELTRKTFYFDFEEWYQKGHWQDKYIPHVLVDDGKVISNVSVNLMEFLVDGEVRNYIQLGTVMTDENYRGQGLNRYIMERILDEYKDKVDGIYLFGNDTVLEYYPKFGFEEAKEYEYICSLSEKQSCEDAPEYKIEKVNLADANEGNKLYEAIRQCSSNPNDAFYMCNNLGLYQFWLAAEYEQSVYHVPEIAGYVIADVEGETLVVHQILSKKILDVRAVLDVFDSQINEIRLKYTPTYKKGFEVREFKEEDTTLFVMGEQLKQDMEKKILFPVMSHA